ncbi:MAG: M20/M25/M40 family metallo-hydrolase [Deltaproteobacteria bacterium]|nr:M20/M25/M40 family metallo-hydrolase [Deltaproteobacteria bacterium]
MNSNLQRLSDTFTTLVRIDSPSKEEAQLAHWLKSRLAALGAEVYEDDSQAVTGSNTGNLIARLPGDSAVTPLLFCVHMDTVEPGRGIQPQFNDGIFTSSGDTILGADDKAAIAILLEVLALIQENGIPHGPLEFLFTVCEEIGLLGAKALDISLLQARSGYALDATDVYKLITQAPCATRFKASVIGKAAHAGANPEAGINAIQLAAKAISAMPLGRVDADTTANIGLIQGGKATNIIPDLVEIHGEVRSHDPERLRKTQDEILSLLHRVIEDCPKQDGLPRLETSVQNDYPVLHIDKEHAVVAAVMAAAASLSRELVLGRTGGGSDANILCGKGITCAVMGIGMERVHTVNEFIRLKDMENCCELVLAIIREWR